MELVPCTPPESFGAPFLKYDGNAMTDAQRFDELVHRLRSKFDGIDPEEVYGELASIILESDGDDRDQLIQDIFVKLHPHTGLEVIDRIHEADQEITLDCRCVIDWLLEQGSTWGLGKGLGSLIRTGVFDADEVADELIEQLRNVREEKPVDELSFALWVIYCGSWTGTASNWEIVMNDVNPRKEELHNLLKLEHLTDYAAGCIRKCLARFS